MRAGNSELAGTIWDYIHNLVSVAVIPLIAQLAGAVGAQRVAGLDHGTGVPLNVAFKIRRLADDVGLSVGFRAADLAVAVGVVAVHMGRNLALGGIDFGQHIAAGLAGEIVNIHIGCRFGGAQHGRAFGVRRAVDQKGAFGADLPVSLPVALIGALFIVGAGDTAAVAAEVIGVLAVSVLTVLGTGLAQAADFAQRFLSGTLAAVGAGVGVPLAGVIRTDVVLFAVLAAFRTQLAGLAKVVGVEAVGAARAHMLVIVVGVLLAAAVLAVGAFGAAGAASAELTGVVAGALAAVGAEVVLVVAALDAIIVVAAHGLGVFAAAFLAQATVVAKIQTGAVPAALALQAAGQLGAARTVRSVAAIAAPALNAVVVVKVDVLVAVVAVVVVAHAAALAEGVVAGLFGALFARRLVRGAFATLEAVLVVLQGALLAEFTVPAVIALVLEKAAATFPADDRFAGAVRRFQARRMLVILGAHAQAAANALLAHGAVDFLELGYTFTAIVALGADAAVVLFTAIIAVLFRLLLSGAFIAVAAFAAVTGEVSVGAARAAVVDAVGLLVAVVVALSGTSAADAAAIFVPVVVPAARTFHSVLIGGVDMKLHT